MVLNSWTLLKVKFQEFRKACQKDIPVSKLAAIGQLLEFLTN